MLARTLEKIVGSFATDRRPYKALAARVLVWLQAMIDEVGGEQLV
jgi:hypothetical protein